MSHVASELAVGRTRIGIGLLATASVLLIAAGAYAHSAASNPNRITLYHNIAFIVEPRISAAEIIAFVALEHLLVVVGVWHIVRGKRRRPAADAGVDS